jgi:hypothetical protein
MVILAAARPARGLLDTAIEILIDTFDEQTAL